MPALNPVTERPIVKHRWDGKTFHVQIFANEADAASNTSGPWYDNQRTARACWEQANKAGVRPTAPVQQPDPVAAARVAAIGEVLQEDRRRALFANAKKLGLSVWKGIATDELQAKVEAEIAGQHDRKEAEIARQKAALA